MFHIRAKPHLGSGTVSNADIAFLSKQLRDLAADVVSKKSPLFLANVHIREALRRGAFDDVRLTEFRHLYATGQGVLSTTAYALEWLSSNAERVSLPYASGPMPDILKSMAGATLPPVEIIGPHLLAVADLMDSLAGNNNIDMTPGYPRPDHATLNLAVWDLLSAVEYFSPDCDIRDTYLVRVGIGLGYTPGQTMWAICELIQKGVVVASPISPRDPSRRFFWGLENTAPSGVTVATGSVQLSGEHNSWGHMKFAIDHHRISEIKQEVIPPAPSNDTPRDTPPKPRKKRTMNSEAADCARLFKAAHKRDPSTRMNEIIASYVAKKGGSAASIMRTLNDNPDQWKSDKKTT